jgi:hypothetical protein
VLPMSPKATRKKARRCAGDGERGRRWAARSAVLFRARHAVPVRYYPPAPSPREERGLGGEDPRANDNHRAGICMTCASMGRKEAPGQVRSLFSKYLSAIVVGLAHLARCLSTLPS